MNATQAVLVDFVSRVREGLENLPDDLSQAQATHQIDAEANTICWLTWHIGRCIDAQLHGIIGGDQLWEQWRDRLAIDLSAERLGHGEVGYAQSPADAALVQPPIEQAVEYALACTAELADFVAGVTDQELARVIDEEWDPPVTLAIRVVSIIDDSIQHLGQAAYVKGVAQRSGVR